MVASSMPRAAAAGSGSTAGVQLRSRRLPLASAVAAVLAAVMLGGPEQPATAAPAVVARAGGQRPGQPTGTGRVEILRLPSGDADRRLREVWVYRPPGRDRADLPVMYFLHGYPGNDRNGESVGLPALLDQASAAAGRGFVVALPDGESAIHPDTEWADSVDGKVRLERFITLSLVRAVEGRHPRDRQHRAIAGFSMGGYGAMNIGLRHPGLYGQIAAVAGYFHPDDPDRMGGGRAGWAAANSPDRLLHKAHRTRLLVIDDAGEHDPLITGEAIRFTGLARASGLHPTLAVAPGGHDWPMVASQVPAMARFFDAGWPRRAVPHPRRGR
jgi:S-formylglutathione hydrolase FrmB